METDRIGAVVLTGGSAVRLDGADKASIELGGLTLLEHALGALLDIDEVVVVGDPVPTTRPVTFTREDPRGGGPAAGVLAGLRAFARKPDVLVVLAVDMPLVTSSTVRRLTLGLEHDGAVLIDDGQRVQYLCAAYRTAALLAVGPSYEEEYGMSMRRLVGRLRLDQVPAFGPETRDIDTWSDLRDLRETFGE
ncbi:molybdenum cofactor guanylyltransferase [Nocardioides marmoriginsengisoli]|uniref:Molybdenum cofactor guanylyltransferase n=1 Tax=Nocardioides marmoriginsengisoli TaxID=661483 RepID=A0A3N0CGE3_9ACTN|nr:molybdenum cofactor guanylyltransferase [Nocardioides marmoriginsengisoli]RNL62073.1 molybdenum cofactor guanylyltransferase [Nocardioides marmoriginsengisoli]